MKTLVFGSKSGVGKELQLILPEKYDHTGNNEVVYFDSEQCNLAVATQVNEIIYYHKPDNIILLAAKVGGIFDNVAHQYEYLNKNIVINTNMIDACRHWKVNRFLALSSTCAYPDISDPYKFPLKEYQIHDGPPTPTNFGYGYAKRLMQAQIETCNQQYGTNYSYLIPCNLYGQFSKYGDEAHFLGKLIRQIWEYNHGKRKEIKMAGGGSAKRQYLYTPDLARCIKLWLDKNEDTPLMANIAPTENLPIAIIAEIALKVCGCDANVSFLDENMAGQLRKDVSSNLLLSRYPEMQFTSIRDGIKETYKKVSETWALS